MNWKRMSIAGAVPMFVVIVFSIARAGDDAESLLKQLEKKYDGINDASVVFTKHVQYGVMKTEQTFAGKLIMKKGNKYRIEIEDQTFVTDGKSVWSFTKSTNQVIIDNYKEDSRSISIDKLLVNAPQHYRAIILGKEKIHDEETTILKMIPVDPKSNMQWMKVWVDEDRLMKRIQVLDISDNLTTYSIDSIKTNTGISDGRFQFTVPAGVEAVDLR